MALIILTFDTGAKGLGINRGGPLLRFLSCKDGVSNLMNKELYSLLVLGF